jgi:hypothetical protein
MEANQCILKRFQLNEMHFNAIQNGFNCQEYVLTQINLYYYELNLQLFAIGLEKYHSFSGCYLL